MNYYQAPMEGINIALYRNAHQDIFEGVDKYFTPFLVPNDGIRFRKKQLDDVKPEFNPNIHIVPQIMTNKAEDFIRTAEELSELGYREVNLNLGCPSGTVVSKKKGSGFLYYPEELERFLYQIFEKCEIGISIKTRLGRDETEEFYKILEIYNQFQMTELIIHPRIQKDLYKNPPKLTFLDSVIQESKNKVCYNGDIFSVEDCEDIQKRYPGLDSIMLARGMVANPALAREIKKRKQLEKGELKEFHDRLYSEYQEKLFGDTNLLYRMKEYWYYMIQAFPDSKKYAKRIKKARQLDVYNETINELFDTLNVGGMFNPYK